MFRTIKTLLLPILACMLMVSCQKEYSEENGNTPGSGGSTGGTAVFTFGGGTAACTTPSVAGTYTQGTALTANEKITLIVDVTTAGTYSVSTGTNNGVQFTGTGTFTTTGANFIELTAVGKIPAAGGTFNYIPGANGCNFSVTYTAVTGGGGGGGSTANCKACEYVPMCDGSVFTYIDTTFGGGGTEKVEALDIIKDTTIDGKLFQKFSNPGADGYTNCTNGVTTLIAYNVPSSGGTIQRIDQTVLKANEPVGATWQNVFSQGAGQTAIYDWKIIAKGLTKTVLGVTYTDVIQVHLVLSATAPGIPQTVGSEGDYYYAKGIGLIDNTTYSTFGGNPILTLHRVLKAYSIP